MFTLMLEGQEDVTVADWLAYAEAAERLGYDGFFTSDHYFSVVGAEGRGSLDVWGVLCALAAVTKRIQLGTMVSPVTFRPPVVLAKLALVADGLSGGRVELGLGTGWHETEHKKFGLPFPPFGERLAMLAEQAEIIRRLTDGETLDFAGAHYTLEGATLLPRPVERPAADPLRRLGQAEGRRAGGEVGRRLQPLPCHARRSRALRANGSTRRARRSAATPPPCR